MASAEFSATTLPPARPTLVLPTEITHPQAGSCLRMLLTTAQSIDSNEQPIVVVDAAQLSRFDSSALAVLIECRRAVHRAGQRFAVRNIPERLAELARLYGVEKLLQPSSRGSEKSSGS